MRVKKIDYTVGAGISHGKPYTPGERRKYGQKQQGTEYKEIAARTSISEEELAEIKEEGGVIRTEGTQLSRRIVEKIKKKQN